MIPARIPENEQERIQELYRMLILDTQSEKDFDEIVQVASRICKVPISLISLVDTKRQWFKAKIGLNDEEINRDFAFCAHTILQDDIFQVEDAVKDERFVDNPLVTSDPNIRFYAGVPLVTSKGFKLGSLCVIDSKPRQLNEDQLFALDVLSKQVIKLFELRLRNMEIEAKNAIVESQKQHLEELSQIQSKVISIVAHDVRSPVAALKNVLDLKKSDDITNEEMNDFMVMVSKQLDGTIDMLTNLVEWGSILLNKSEVKLAVIQLHDLVASKIGNLEVSFQVKHNHFNNQLPVDCIVYTDENMIRFILRNLLSNANKFTEGGTISIIGELIGDEYKITVADTGIGMSEDIQKNLFKTNRKSSRPGTNKEIGSGLGLVLVKEFIDRLGSKLIVESALNKGTQISFFLPKKDPKALIN
ncbi:MAG: GAF domain-containing sensor histidine kinase [Sediminibacterium sp.]|nr:GAF domain-containing sensor histidine kinase [Sediminibacterium sp.]